MVTEQMTTIDGVLTADIDSETVTITLRHDAGGETAIEIPAFKFAWIVETFATYTAANNPTR